MKSVPWAGASNRVNNTCMEVLDGYVALISKSSKFETTLLSVTRWDDWCFRLTDAIGWCLPLLARNTWKGIYIQSWSGWWNRCTLSPFQGEFSRLFEAASLPKEAVVSEQITWGLLKHYSRRWMIACRNIWLMSLDRLAFLHRKFCGVGETLQHYCVGSWYVWPFFSRL